MSSPYQTRDAATIARLKTMLAAKDAEIERLRAEAENLRTLLHRAWELLDAALPIQEKP